MKDKKIARIENDFIFKAHYALSAIEQKIVLFLISRIDPVNDKKFIKQTVSIKYVEKMLWEGEKVGDPFAYLQEVVLRLIERKLTFPKGAKIGEKKIYAGAINWFQSIVVLDTEDGIGIEFMFSERMKPFLLELNEYVRINAMDIMSMKGKHAIRMYQVFKAERSRTKKYKKNSPVKFDVDELKKMLGIENRYKMFNNFKRRVLDPLKDEINEHSSEIEVKYNCTKTGRKITGVQFSISSRQQEEPKNVDFIPTKQEIENLTFAKEKAYNALTRFGVTAGIAYKRIIPTIKGAGVEGYEDIFTIEAIKIFKNKSKAKTAGAFVDWWMKKIFDVKSDNGLFFQISEKVHAYEKELDDEKKDNRKEARNMTATAFRNLKSK